ncbi:hypothetical protein M9Y10_039116 [Tritrichomonas musculus]|uniref:Uncharacterized protein n=1 Tax=Tritrichomonas musculus TaxID=1915356 RepID=A0ABR2KAB8_9EUKA
MEIDWNLDPRKISEIPIYQIHFKNLSLENHANTISLRLLVLAHKLALSDIPAFYLDTPLSFQPLNSSNTNLNQSVIIFDIDGKFEQNEIQNLPFWTHLSQWKWIPHKLFTDQIADTFSRALTLRLYYKHIDLHPLYFTSYILIPGGISFFEPFLVQPVPVLRQGSIQIRTVLQSGLDCIPNPRNPPPAGSFILFPPNEHPLLINSLEPPNLLTAMTIDKKTITIDTSFEKFVYLTNPSLIIPKFFEDDNDSSLSSSVNTNNINLNNYNINSNINPNIKIDNEKEDVPLCQFSNVQLFNYTEKDIENYFISKFSNENSFEFGHAEKEKTTDNINQNDNDLRIRSNKNDETNSNISFLEDTLPNAKQIITEMIPSTNMMERQIILSCIGVKGTFPSKRSYLTCIKANFLSYYRFDFGFSTVNPPSFMKRFGQTSRVSCKKLGIPYILLNKNGDKYEEQADRALSLWESERFMPISGPKDAHYVVFAMNTVNMDSVKDFMSQLTNVYANCGFGALTPYPRKDFIMSVPLNDIRQTLMDYFDPLTEFQQYPVITFIVAPPIFSASFKPHSIVNYIRPNALDTATLEEVKTLAFVVYSRIRVFTPQPTGMIEPLAQQEVGVVLFGFRYQPPFLLSRTAKSSTNNDGELNLGFDSVVSQTSIDDQPMELHVAWDPTTSLSVWIDGIGSILHFLPAEHVMSISNFIEKAKQVLKVKTKFTVTILGEGISTTLYAECDNGLPPDVEIYSVSPSPSVSAHFDEDFADDVVIFEQPEQCYEVPKRDNLSTSNPTSFNQHQQPHHQNQMHNMNSNDFNNNNNTIFYGFDGFDNFDGFDDFRNGFDRPNNMNLNMNHNSNNNDDCFVPPSVTCYVMSKYQPPYMVSIYRNGNDQQLLKYVTKVSHLSWLSVKPGDEKRTISYPPHICALLRKNDCRCLTISRFEFLPSQEKI